MERNLKRLYIKVGGMFSRLVRALALLPIRLFRFFKHIFHGLKALAKGRFMLHKWWMDAVFLSFDLAALPEIYETLADFFKWNTRPLNPAERKLAESVFGDALDLDAICFDDRARIGCKKRNIAYVSFFTVNCWGRIQAATFIHELVHVWQYQKMGAAYMTKALRAQRSKAGYNYGGIAELRMAMEKKGKLTDFNLEQQADIVADYYLIREGYRPTWGKGGELDLPVYLYFMAQIRTPTA
ncbi:MAG: hypothetical protein IT258_24545 [Saprospiraceae bacterium]|nr:hypothetical protein [Saprospiraceae bacterium]